MTGCSNMPTGCKEFISRFGKIVGSATQFFRITNARLGSMPCTGSISSTNAGSNDSMPSTGMALAMDSSMSSAFGMEPIRDFARTRTFSVSCSSRHGVAQTIGMSLPYVRWSDAWNSLMVSISSPKNSIRTGCGNVGGNTSIMPPRTANSPRSITKSTRVYAFSTSRCDASSSANSSPWENTSGSTSPKPATTG